MRGMLGGLQGRGLRAAADLYACLPCQLLETLAPPERHVGDLSHVQAPCMGKKY